MPYVLISRFGNKVCRRPLSTFQFTRRISTITCFTWKWNRPTRLAMENNNFDYRAVRGICGCYVATDFAPQSPLMCFGAKSAPLNVGDGQSIEWVKIIGERYISPKFRFRGMVLGQSGAKCHFPSRVPTKNL